MTLHTFVTFGLYLTVLLVLAWPLGLYTARVLEGGKHPLSRLFGWLERGLFRLAGVKETDEQPWTRYALSFLVFNAAGLFLVYLLQRLQGVLPLNPAGLPAVSPHLAFNTAVSFATNTNWQSYGGETTMSHLTQMLGLTVQNFVSAAAGIAVFAAIARGFSRRKTGTVGSFWVDLTRSTLYVLLPLSFVLALALVSQGVVQTFSGKAEVPYLNPPGPETPTQTIALGPAASQVAIKQLGTNGGGFYNVNSAHPLENPTPLSSFLELLAILLIPAALCFTFGRMVKDDRQGRALLVAMTAIFVVFASVCALSEQRGNPVLTAAGVDQAASSTQGGGNMEGKEARFGVADSTLWATATTAASNGSVNSMHDSYTPLGGLMPMVLMQLGEVVFGGVGSGLYGMLVFALVAVFVSGLMVGRTPEYLGKKLEPHEMKMASLVILLPALGVLVGAALAVASPEAVSGLSNPGAHGFSQILYATSSAANNNGSAFAGLTANLPFTNTLLGILMLVGRYGAALPVLAIAGSLAKKGTVAASAGTLPTHGPLFVTLLVGVVILVGALTFLPALALGPIVEALRLS